MFVRAKKSGNYKYLQIVHTYREGKKVKQRVVSTLGRLDKLQKKMISKVLKVSFENDEYFCPMLTALCQKHSAS